MSQQYFLVILIIALNKVVNFLEYDHSNELRTEQYFPVMLFIILYKVVLTLESVDQILKFDYSNDRYRAVYSFQRGCAIYYAVH